MVIQSIYIYKSKYNRLTLLEFQDKKLRHTSLSGIHPVHFSNYLHFTDKQTEITLTL